MINLLKQKHETVNLLKKYTEEILALSPKLDDEKISNMIEERQEYIDSISIIDLQINELLTLDENNNLNTEEINQLNKSIKESVKEIIQMDKVIRKAINTELIDVKIKLNQPQTKFNSLNIKA